MQALCPPPEGPPGKTKALPSEATVFSVFRNRLRCRDGYD